MHSTYMIAFIVLVAVCCSQGRTPRRCVRCPPALITPICGSDGRLYKNQCDLKSADCRSKTRITEVPWKDCKFICDAACTLEFTQVCGEDGKIYGGNRCTFLWSSCGKPIPLNEAPMSRCQGQIIKG